MAGYATIEVTAAPGAYAARVRAPALGGAVEEAVVDEIRRAFATWPVLAVEDQELDPAGLQAFAGRLGAFGHDPYVAPLPGHPHVIAVRRAAGETAPIFGSQWHSDWSFQATPPSATLLYGAEVPPRGGDTVFAHTARAFAALSPTLKRWLGELEAVHSAAPAYGPRGLFARDDASRSMGIIVSPEAENTERHPVVRTHLPSGRPALFVNHVYTLGLVGLAAAESRCLLEYLFQHMTRAEFLHRHRWQPRTLLLWDNRCLLHLAEGGYEGHARLMYRSTLAGERPVAARC